MLHINEAIAKDLDTAIENTLSGPSLCLSGCGLFKECSAGAHSEQKLCSGYEKATRVERCTHRRFDQFCTWFRNGQTINKA